ncbi:MAG: Uma2 family endonuclease [Actinomycetota bacterium]|nr:Uma2 family endonuclease [Actinomycetota bacterium]
MAVTTKITAEEYFALDLPERHTQLINGEIVVNKPALAHQRIAGEFYLLLTQWCRAEPGRGEAGLEVDVHLDEFNVYAPDVWWVREERIPSRDALRIVGPPDLCVEVRSPSTWRYDVGTKKRVYEATGLPELWLVDTNADTVLVFRRLSPQAAAFDVELELGRGQRLTSPLLPDLAIDLTELFER